MLALFSSGMATAEATRPAKQAKVKRILALVILVLYISVNEVVRGEIRGRLMQKEGESSI